MSYVDAPSLRQLLPAEVALDAPLAERARALVADQKLTALQGMDNENG